MLSISPQRLVKGDEVRIIAPSMSLGLISPETKKYAIDCLHNQLGLKISFAKHCDEKDNFISSSVNSRIQDIHEAFSKNNIKAILSVVGGYNSNQLLNQLDYDLIKNNPKIFCGYSDITALTCAIYKKTSMITFSGPHFSTFGCLHGMDYTIDYFKKCLMSTQPINIVPTTAWSDDEWYLDQHDRHFLPNDGLVVINPGQAHGVIIGGNLCTLNLLHGTPYMPDLNNTILFIEDDYLVFPEIFDRDLQSLIMQPEFSGVKAIIIGRFQQKSNMSLTALAEICHRKPELADLPILANADFGHTSPMLTFPIGGQAKLDANGRNTALTLEW